MNAFFRQFLRGFLGVFVIHAFLSVPLSYGAANLAVCNDAEPICDLVDSSSTSPSSTVLNRLCALPSPLPSNLAEGEVEAALTECQETIRSKWGQVGPACDVMDYSDAHKNDAAWLGGAYGLAAAACLISCACELANGCAGAYVGFLAACTGAALAVGGFDIGVSNARKDEFSQKADAYKDVIGPSLAMLGGLSTGVATAVSGGTGGFAANAGTKATSCLTFGIMGLQAVLKGIDSATAEETKASACELVKKQASSSMTLQSSVRIDGDTSGYGSGGGSGGGGGGTSGPGDTPGAGGNPGGSDRGLNLDNIPRLTAAVQGASAGDITKTADRFFKKLPAGDVVKEGKKIPGFIQSAMGARAGSLEGMMKPLMSTLSGTPATEKAAQQIQGAIAKTDAEFKKRMQEYQKKALAGTAYTGGGSAKASAGAAGAASPFSFGLLGGSSAGGGPSEIKFTGVAANPAAAVEEFEHDDIFHSNDKGTLFQIVSKKISRVKGRVDEYEWDLPLNRARQNLPWKSSSEGLRKAPSVPQGATGTLK